MFIQCSNELLNPRRSNHRTKLLQAARTLLRERTYGNITARDLVAASNTNLGSIGYHLLKRGAFNEAIGLAFEEWADRSSAPPTSTRGPGHCR